ARFAYGGFREGVNASGRNVIFVAPTLGSRSEAGDLLKPGGLDTYLAKVLGLLGKGVPSGLGNLILACHRGGGKPMRALSGSPGTSVSKTARPSDAGRQDGRSEIADPHAVLRNRCQSGT